MINLLVVNLIFDKKSYVLYASYVESNSSKVFFYTYNCFVLLVVPF